MVKFIQYLRPNAETREIYISQPPETTAMADAIRKHGGRLTAEVVEVGIVSLACEYNHPEEGETDIVLELVKNGPGMSDGVNRMIRRSWAEIQRLEKKYEDKHD